jgi:hypothetical protein
MAVAKKKTVDDYAHEAMENGMSHEEFEQKKHEFLEENENLTPVAAAAKVVEASLLLQKDKATVIRLILKHRMTIASLKENLELSREEGWFKSEPKIAALNTDSFQKAFEKDAVVRRRENIYVDNLKNPTKGFFRQGQARWPEWLQKLFLKKLLALSSPARDEKKWKELLGKPPRQLADTDSAAKKAIDNVAAEFSMKTSGLNPSTLRRLLKDGMKG